MGKPTVYNFSLIEVGKLLIRDAGIKEGLWKVGVSFAFGAANTGTGDNDLRPTAMVRFENFLLSAVEVRDGLTIDAAEVFSEDTGKKKVS